jgi:hypothetical protein
VVDAGAGAPFSSANIQAAIGDMVAKVMAVPPSDPRSAAAAKILRDHYDAALAAKATASNALRSTFSAACQAPSNLALGI